MILPPDGFIAELAVKRVVEGIQGGDNLPVTVSFRNQFFKDRLHSAGIPVFRQRGHGAYSAVADPLPVQAGFIVVIDNPGHHLSVIGKRAPVLILAFQALLPVLLRIFHLHMESHGGNQVRLKMFFRFQFAYFHTFTPVVFSYSGPVFYSAGQFFFISGRMFQSAGSQSTVSSSSLPSHFAASCSSSFGSPEVISHRKHCMERWNSG